MFLIALIAMWVFAGGAAAQEPPPPPIARYVPSAPDLRHVFVLDSAHVLSPPTVAALQDSARALQTETHADVVWVTLPTLGGRAIEEAALYVGRTWRIGSAGVPGDPLRNRGLVILYVPDKTTTAGSNFRVEVGNGLEGTITDSRSRTITAAMRNALRAKRYDDAYLTGWNVAAALVREDFAARGKPAIPVQPVAAASPAPAHEGLPSDAVLPLLVMGLTLLLAVVFGISRRRTQPPTMVFRRRDNALTYGDGWSGQHWLNQHSIDDDERRRASTPDITSWSGGGFGTGGGFGGGADSSSGGGSFGGGGGFSGGGSSDSI